MICDECETVAHCLKNGCVPKHQALKPLTDEQIQHLVNTYVGEPNARYPLDNSDWMNFARAVEAAHGIEENK